MGEISKRLPIVDYFFLTVGAAIMGLGIGVFLVDAQVVPGGVSGLSMALYYLSAGTLPVGIMIWVLNIPLYFWGLKELGKTFGVRTFYAFTLNSFFIDFFRGEFPGLKYPFLRLQDSQTIQELLKNDFFFFIFLGAAFLGMGLGIIFKFHGTTAGSDIVAAIMKKKFGIKPGTSIIVTDFFVIAFAGFIIDWKGLAVGSGHTALSLTLFALFLLFVSSKLVDIIIDGFDYARAVYVISEADKTDKIAEVIMHDLSRGATALKARGLYMNKDREILYTIITIKEVPTLMEKIKEIDPNAFVIINDVYEVMGEGFRRRI